MRPYDEALTQRIRGGDERIFTAVFTQHRAALCRYAQRFVRSREAAEDVVHDVFLRLWSQHRHLVVRTTFKAYLYATVRNQALDELAHARVARRHYKRAMEENAAARTRYDSREGVLQMDREEAFLGTLDEIAPSLTARGREVLVLSVEHGLTYRETGAILHIAPDTVRLHLIRARKILRAALVANQGDEDSLPLRRATDPPSVTADEAEMDRASGSPRSRKRHWYLFVFCAVEALRHTGFAYDRRADEESDRRPAHVMPAHRPLRAVPRSAA